MSTPTRDLEHVDGAAARRPRHLAYERLAAGDVVLRRIVAEHGHPDPFVWAGGAPAGAGNFAALVLHVTSQQISTAVALRTFARLRSATAPRLTPRSLARLSPEELRAVGLSWAKVASLRDLADRHLNHTLDVDDLADLTDEEAQEALTAVRGIGPWTAQMFLIHQLRRPDVLPAGDLGIRQAVHRGYATAVLPPADEVARLGTRWAPYRTYAAALLWASLRPGPAAPRST